MIRFYSLFEPFRKAFSFCINKINNNNALALLIIFLCTIFIIRYNHNRRRVLSFIFSELKRSTFLYSKRLQFLLYSTHRTFLSEDVLCQTFGLENTTDT